jgi:hypothetical protein
MTTASFTDRPAWKFVMFAGFAGVLAYLLSRNLGLHPNIFADEWYYSKMSRLMPLGEAIVPSYLYLWLFRATNACGTGFYDCVHIGNTVLFLAAAPLVYLVARQVAGKAPAFAVALMSALAPLNVYTAYFMPEATYYFGFWVLAWIALTRTHWHLAVYALTTGLVLGLMSLVKVHALFQLPALCLFLVYVQWTRGAGWLMKGLAALALAAVAMVTVRFALGYLLAGDAALNLFGSFYSSTSTYATHRPILSLLPPAFINGRGHLYALAILLPLPLALVAQSVLRPPKRLEAGKLELLHLFALLMLGAAAGMTIAYTATIANPGVTTEGLRLHLRYYSFVFPLLWIAVAATVGKPAVTAKPALRWSIALLVGAVLVVSIFKLRGYDLNPVDGPEIYAVNPNNSWGLAIVGLDLAVLLLWALGNRLAAPVFMFLAMPAMIACGGVVTSNYLAVLRDERPTERVGALVRRVVPPEERGLVTVAGSNIQQLMQTQFNIDHQDTTLMELPWDAPIASYNLPVRNKWLVVLGNHPLPEGIKPVVQTAEYALVQAGANHRRLGKAVFNEPFEKTIIARTEGLSHVELWGRWSYKKQVVIHFKVPLPRHLNVIIRAQAFDVNATLPFTVQVGGKTQSFRLAASQQDISLFFETDGTARSLVIDVPRPISPAQLGYPADKRMLGIGISEIEIGSADEPPVANN